MKVLPFFFGGGGLEVVCLNVRYIWCVDSSANWFCSNFENDTDVFSDVYNAWFNALVFIEHVWKKWLKFHNSFTPIFLITKANFEARIT